LLKKGGAKNMKILSETESLHRFLTAMLSSGGIRNSGIAEDLLKKSKQEIEEITAICAAEQPNNGMELTPPPQNEQLSCLASLGLNQIGYEPRLF
jgi:hypothetical protein